MGFVAACQGDKVVWLKAGGRYWQAMQDSFTVQKMGPPGVKHGLEIHPPAGGIEGIFPVFGKIVKPKQLTFRWQGKVKGEKPALFLFAEGKIKQRALLLPVQAETVTLPVSESELPAGKVYHWYLGRIESGKHIGQSRVYAFEFLSKNQTRELTSQLTKLGDLPFLQAQIYYHYQLYHDMVGLLESLYSDNKTEGLKRLLFLGYVRLGRHGEAKKFAP